MDALQTVLLAKLAHIDACVEVWEQTGVGRPRAIRRTVEELRALLTAPRPEDTR